MTTLTHKKKILVTGANGLLGQKLIGFLREDDTVETIATARGSNRLPFTKGYSYLTMDITDAGSIESAFSAVKPDVVIHTAAMTNVDQCEAEKENCWKQNVTAVEYLVRACRNHGSFLLHLSTDFIFDGTAGPYREDDEPNPISFYGWSKYAAEKAIIHSDIRWAIARTILVYGIAHDMSRSNIVLWVKKSLEEGKTIQVVDDQWRTPTLAEDLAIGCMLIARSESPGVFNISGKDLLTPYEMAHQTADYFGLDKDLIRRADSTTFTQPARRPAKTGFVLDKAESILGYAPRSFSEGIGILASQLKES